MLRSLFFMLVLFFTISTTAQTTVGLIGYFPLSGNYNNSGSASATANGVNTSFTTNACSASNSAVQFQGNTGSYINFVDNGNFDFTGTQNFTVGFSFFFNGNTTSGLVDNCLNYGGWGVWLWSTVAGTWNLQFNYKNASVGSAAATNFTPGSWHHATAVRNNGFISLYVDGVFRLSATEGTTAPSYPINMEAGSMCFAGFSPPRYNPHAGKIDELRIYNRALSATEIQGLSDAALLACCSSSSVLAVSGPSTICAGGTANLTTTITGGVSPYTVVYTDGTTNFTVNNYVSGSNIPVTPSVTKSYSLVSVTDATACVGTGNTGNPTITVTPLPAATISYTGSPYCSNAGTAVVTRTGTAGGTYSSTAGLTINAATGDVTLGSSTPGTYTVTYAIAASGGCAAVTATTSITITQLPAATISYAGSPYCSNAGTAAVTRTGTAGGTYSSTAGLIINAATGDVTLGTSTPGTYTVTYTIAAAGGCPAFSTTGTITITAASFATISYTGSPYCSNAGTAVVTRTGTAGGTYSSTAGLTINTTTGDVILGTSTPGTYTVTYTLAAAGSCPGFTATATITITAAPSATISYTGSPYCSNAGTATVTRTGTAGGTYSSAAGLTINAATGDITLGTSTPGTYTVTYTIAASGGCAAVTANTSITITQLPAATISYAGSPYCSNAGTATVTRTGTAGGTYSSTAGLIINATTGDVTLGTSIPGTYTVTYTVAAGGGCSLVSATTIITITQLPAAVISYAGSPYCSNAGTAVVTRTGTAGGTYSSTAGLTISATTGDVTLGTSTPGTYTVTYTVAAGGGCPAFSTTATIAITAAPAATISYAGSPYCSNAGTATVTRTGTAGGTYSATPAGLTINATTGDVTLGTSTPGTYSITYSIAAAGGCGVFSTTTSITVTALPAATILYPTSPYCSNAGIATVSRTGTAGGTYSAAPAGLALNATTGDVTPGSSTPGTYTVTYTLAAAGGCPAVTATTSITVTALAAATISYAGSPYCQTGGTATVTRTGTAGGTYSATPAGLTINAATGDVTPGTSTAGTYTVTYSIAAGGGCPPVTTSATITIIPAPAATIAYTGSPYCSNGGTATVTRTGTAGGTYSSTAGLTINAATGDVTLGTSTPGTYTVTYTIAASGGCAAFTTTATITITATPSASISYAGNPYCYNVTSAPVTLTGSTGGTFTASPAGLTINAATGTVTPVTSTPGTYTVTYTVAGCASATATTSITIIAAPNMTIFYAGTPYCSNAGTATVSQFGTTGGTYSASPAGLAINAATGAVNLGSSTPGTYTVTYSVTVPGCGATITTTAITVTAAPNATISYAGSPYCANAGTAGVTLTGTAGGTYTAAPAGLSINASTGAVNLAASTAGTYTVTYTVAAGGGCATYTTTANITITALAAATISYPGSPYCSNAGIATVTRTGTAGGAYTASPAGLSINAITGDVNLAASTPGSYTVSYTLAAGGGCAAVTATTAISITTLPAATITYAGNPYCADAGTAIVTRTGTAGGTYTASPVGLSINAATGTVILGTSTPGTYTVFYTIAAGGGCGVVTATTAFTVNALSVDPAGATASSNSICGPGTVTLNVTGGSLGAGASWKWYSGSCGGTLVGTGATVSLPVNSTATYFVRAEGTCNTTACASVTVTVNTQPTISITASRTTLLPGQTTTLTATVTSAAGNTITWYRNGLAVPGASGTTLVVTVDGIGKYTARITTTAGCTALSNEVIITPEISSLVFVYPNPSTGRFQVRVYNQLGKQLTVNIYDKLGQRVFSQRPVTSVPYTRIDVDLRGRADGIYVVEVVDGDNQVVGSKRVVIAN